MTAPFVTREQIAYLAGLGLVSVLGLLDPPVALVLAAGHLLAARERNRLLAAFGQALEEA